ncbi:sugar phosphate nucleotidyltransferase [Clostridium sp. BNL1100]|uniref:sugar phosphate nucleotidyltransferase n=1 Tax=Clostridium sp. BNL1100 TaxID=755731 RepID=UPI00024A72F4|nr:sugar phosphate nucleotidyltransferase [Clostridium sp. BNL1100]AEY67245.1 dTDP-glucose pyrophosphorylase [Clostridium sp. BNL1100]
MKPLIGYIPAGGRGMRMKPFRLLKELLPVFVPSERGNDVVLLIENAIQTLVFGGANDIICTVSKEKEAIIQSINDYYVGNTKANFAFVYQNLGNNEYGIPYAINESAPFLRGHTVFMKFPDTIIYPQDSFKQLYEFHTKKGADLTLGVFPTSHAERLGPVVMRDDGRVIRIEDKPKKPSVNNTWNILIWEDSFLNLLVEYVENIRNSTNVHKELLMYDIFYKAIESKLNVYGYTFEDGFCHDISCLEDAKNIWSQSGNAF